jgi:hypothetical protein
VDALSSLLELYRSRPIELSLRLSSGDEWLMAGGEGLLRPELSDRSRLDDSVRDKNELLLYIGLVGSSFCCRGDPIFNLFETKRRKGWNKQKPNINYGKTPNLSRKYQTNYRLCALLTFVNDWKVSAQVSHWKD